MSVNRNCRKLEWGEQGPYSKLYQPVVVGQLNSPMASPGKAVVACVSDIHLAGQLDIYTVYAMKARVEKNQGIAVLESWKFGYLSIYQQWRQSAMLTMWQ